jgi:hypothetical protein
MIIYLASPKTQLQAESVSNMPVLLSFSHCLKFIIKDHQQTFRRILIDSGAFSEMSKGTRVDGKAYHDWWQQWVGHADAKPDWMI